MLSVITALVVGLIYLVGADISIRETAFVLFDPKLFVSHGFAEESLINALESETSLFERIEHALYIWCTGAENSTRGS
jgi:flagellar basal body rod protein FlgF